VVTGPPESCEDVYKRQVIALIALELFEIRLFRLDEGVHQRTRQPRMALDVLVLYHDETMDRVNAAAAKPIGLDLFDIGDQFRIGIGSNLADLIPTADRRLSLIHI